jgi:hypothetical protein
MSPIFNLSHIQKVIAEIKPSAAIILDTTVIMRESNYTIWRTSLANPLFVLPCMIKLELENLRNRPEYFQQATNAIKNVMELCHTGQIEKGIYRPSQGWFINVELPNKQVMDAELEKLETFVTAIGPARTELIILAQELMRLNPDFSVIFTTTDEKLQNALKFMGINACLFQGFPIENIEHLILKNDLLLSNWDRVLQDIQRDAQKKLVPVEVTLLSKTSDGRCFGHRPGSRYGQLPAVIARGSGVLHSTRDIPFSWTLPFSPWNLPSQTNSLDSCLKEENGVTGQEIFFVELGTVSLDFDDATPEIPPLTIKALGEKLGNCASPLAYVEDMPTLQDPVSVMKQFFLFEIVYQDSGFPGGLPSESLNEMEHKFRDTGYLKEWAFHWLYERNAKAEDISISRNEFLAALSSCWSVGETIKFNLAPDTAGRSIG